MEERGDDDEDDDDGAGLGVGVGIGVGVVVCDTVVIVGCFCLLYTCYQVCLFLVEHRPAPRCRPFSTGVAGCPVPPFFAACQKNGTIAQLGGRGGGGSAEQNTTPVYKISSNFRRWQHYLCDDGFWPRISCDRAMHHTTCTI